MVSKSLYGRCMSLAVAGSMVFSGLATAGTLDDVLKRGELICGVDGGLPGFSAADDSGKMQGMDADVCYGIAAAVFGDASKVKFVALTAKERFTALSSGEVDVLSRNTTHTLTRDTTLGINFTYYNFIDGAGLMVKKDLGVKSGLELDGASVCVQAGTTTELNLADFFRRHGMKFTPKGYETSVQTREAFDKGACDVLTSDKSQLAAIRTELANPAGAVILPETLSKEPLGPVVRQGDDEWFNVVKWTLYAMINAEELDISKANHASAKGSDNPAIRRFTGDEGSLCKGLSDKLNSDCFLQIVKQVGNYADSYERNVGENTAIGLKRDGSVNALWRDGGILYAPPMR